MFFQIGNAKEDCIFLDPTQGETGSGLFAACTKYTDKMSYYYDKCVEDTMLRGGLNVKETICDLVAAFARHCAQYGIPDSNWATESYANYDFLQVHCGTLIYLLFYSICDGLHCIPK